MKHSLAKSRLFVLALLFTLLGTSGPILALSKTPYSGVSGLKAGQSRWVVCSGNPINRIDPEGLDDLGQLLPHTNQKGYGDPTWGQVMTIGAFAGGAYGAARVGIPAVYSLILRGQAPAVGGAALEITGGLVLGGDLGPTSFLPSAAVKGAKIVGNLPPQSFNARGVLSAGRYRIHAKGMARHNASSAPPGKSTFFNRVNADSLVLDGAHIADQMKLWDAENKAKLLLSQPIGVHGRTGQPSNVLNIYRDAAGRVHGTPGTPLP